MSSRLRRTIPFLIFFLCYCIMSLFIVSHDDDLVFKAAIEEYGSFWGWATWFACNWGGRVVPQGILVTLLQLPDIVFTIINSFFGTVLVYYTYRVVDYNKQIPCGIWLFGIPFMVIISISAEILAGTVLWKCAAVLYVWGLATMFIALFPYVTTIHQKQCTSIEWIIAFFAVVYTASFEQAGILMSTMCVILLLYILIQFRRIPSARIMFLTAESVGATAFFCFLPGNQVRYTEEIAYWYQGFGMFSLPEKILNGLNYAVSSIEMEIMPVMILMVVAATIIIIRRGYRILSAGALLSVIYLVLCEINTLGSSIGSSLGWFSSVFFLQSFETAIFDLSWARIVAMTVHYMVFVYVGCIVSLAVEKDSRLIVFLLYYGGLCTMLMMGFSPTIHASGSRPCFICFYLMIVIVIKLIEVLYYETTKNLRSMGDSIK